MLKTLYMLCVYSFSVYKIICNYNCLLQFKQMQKLIKNVSFFFCTKTFRSFVLLFVVTISVRVLPVLI